MFFRHAGNCLPFPEPHRRGSHAVCGGSPSRTAPGQGHCCPPVKNSAGELSLEVFQPRTTEDLSFALTELKPDLGVVVAYGRLLNKAALAIPRLGFLNVHFSLLPKYRGAAPVQRALINGETVTGVTVFWLDEGLDTGSVFAAREVPIGPDDYAPELFKKTSEAGLDLLSFCLAEIAAGRSIRTPQAGGATLAPKIVPADTLLDFTGPAAAARDLVRGLACGPRARFKIPVNDRPVVVQALRCSLSPGRPATGARPGVITAIEKEKGFYIQCSDEERSGMRAAGAWGAAGWTEVGTLSSLRLPGIRSEKLIGFR